jgi:hypothetical protein
METYQATRATALGRGSPRERRQQLGGWKRSSTPTPSSAQRGRGCHTTDATRRDDWHAGSRPGHIIQPVDGLLEIDRIWFRAHPWVAQYTRPMVPDEFHPFQVVCTRDHCSWVIVRRHDSKRIPARMPLAVPVGECPALPFTETGQ